MNSEVVLFLMTALIMQDRPLAPAWSPDQRILATTTVPQAFVTPEGGNYSLLFNSKRIYPRTAKHSFFSAYQGWHTFISELAWSPDSQRVAFVEKIYDWEYLDPYNRDFEGRSSNRHLLLAIVSLDGKATGYRLDRIPQTIQLRWVHARKLALNDQCFDLVSNPPKAI